VADDVRVEHLQQGIQIARGCRHFRPIPPRMARAGVPESWSTFPIGTLKTACAACLLLGLLGVPVIGTAAAIGLVLFFVCAAHTHVLTGDFFSSAWRSAFSRLPWPRWWWRWCRGAPRAPSHCMVGAMCRSPAGGCGCGVRAKPPEGMPMLLLRSGRRAKGVGVLWTTLALALLLAATLVRAQGTPVVFDPSTYAPSSACDGFAYVAQTIADGALAAHPNDAAAALDAFDTGVAMFYIGRPMKTVGDALALLRSEGVGGEMRYGSPYWGETGFKPAYMDTGATTAGKPPTEMDQTHHVAAYLSAGINGLELVARLHRSQDNAGDARLGAAAYEIGASLAADPAHLRTIGEIMRRELCDPAGGMVELSMLQGALRDGIDVRIAGR
jgi:hypothetical protein